MRYNKVMTGFLGWLNQRLTVSALFPSLFVFGPGNMLDNPSHPSLLTLHPFTYMFIYLYRDISWKERLFIEEETACGFDNASAREGQFYLTPNPESSKLQSIRLAGMGPRLLVSDLSTKDQPVLRWRLCIKGNTAVEFGIIPANLEHSHTSLHKCASLPGRPAAQSIGFCSAITAGSLLPLSVPIMKGTVLEIIAIQGKLDVCLTYPQDAVQVEWHNGVAVEHPYRGPREVRFEQKYSEDYPVKLAITSWAKAQFEILHTLHYDDELNYSCDTLPHGRCSTSISSGSGSRSPLSHSPPSTNISPGIMHTPSWRTLFYGAPFDQVMDYDGGKTGGMNVDALLQQQLGLGGSGSGGTLSSSPPQSNTLNAVMEMMMDVDE